MPAPSGNCACLSAELAGMFLRTSRLLTSGDRPVNDALEDLLKDSMEALGSDRGFVAMVDYEHGELALKATAGAGWNDLTRKMRLKVSQETGRGITNHVAITGKPYRASDVSKDPHYISHFADVQSELAVPIIDAHGRVEGVINLESTKPDAFGQPHEDFLGAVANLVALRIAFEAQRKRQTALVSLGREMGRFARRSDLLDKVVGLVSQAMIFEDCSVFLMDKEDRSLVLEASRGRLAGKVHVARYAPGEGITGWVAQHGLPVRTRDPRSDARWRGRHEELAPEEVGGLLAVPIHGYNSVLGVFRMLRRRSSYAWVPNDFTDEDEELLTAIASILGAVIESVELVKRVVSTERMAAWGEMSARSAHMIGNRVFAIKGDLNELRHITTTTCGCEALGPIIAGLEKGVTRLEEILAEFREFVMATALKAGLVDINELVKEAVAESTPKDSLVRLEMNLADGLPMVEADASKMRRVFSELVENSFHFLSDDGVIRVSTAMAPERSDRVRITFQDTGPGIPQEAKSTIFRPFYSTRAKGMGLGLSIIKGIIDAHGGTIRETGEEGHGARFEIVLPGITEKLG